jgi:hypothetical protein
MAAADTPVFESLTRPPATKLLTTNIPAPTNLYVTANDFLRVVSQTTNQTQPFNVTYKLLLADGGAIAIESTLVVNPTDGSLQTKDIPLAEGFLLSASVFPAQGGTSFRGTCFVSLQLGTGSNVAPQSLQTLGQDYISSSYGISWPGAPIRSSLEGPGIVQNAVTANPGAGNDFAIVLPAGQRWKLMNLWATLTTNVTVANRLVAFGLKLGLNFQWLHQMPFFQTASQAFTYSYGPGLQTDAGIVADNSLASPNPTIMSHTVGNTSLQSSTSGLQAGDAWTNIISWWEQWIEN